MASARISSKFQVVIPKEIRLQAGIETGQTVQFLVMDGYIALVPDTPLAAARGLLRGIPTDGFRDKEDRQ